MARSTLRTGHDDHELWVEVADTGEGIQPDSGGQFRIVLSKSPAAHPDQRACRELD
jgi:hypothetical protein